MDRTNAAVDARRGSEETLGTAARSLMRLVRTLRSLRPVQLVARPSQWLRRQLLPAVPSAYPPRVKSRWPGPGEALPALVESERIRYQERATRLPPGSLLEAYEKTYGLDLRIDEYPMPTSWSGKVAIEPYPASVRARRLAVAIRLGRHDLREELARASRAVVLGLELHLLGNHLLENGIGLACAGAVSDGAEGCFWWLVGCSLLDWQLNEQFGADGGHFEGSASYHCWLTHGLLEAIELTAASGRQVPTVWVTVASRAVDWLGRVRAPDGSYPMFNDATLDSAPDVDQVLSLARALAIRPRGGAGDEPLVVLPSTGWVIARLTDGSFLALDAGPDGAAYQPGHAHADALSVELWVRGRRTIVDFGVSSYSPGAERDRTRATRSHSTVELAGQNSCEVWSAFRVGRRQRAKLLEANMVEGAINIVASHDGYRYLPGRPEHRRTLELRPGRLCIRDEVLGGDSRGISRLRFASEARDGIRVAASGELERVDDVWYPRYAESHPASVISQPVAPGSPATFWLEW
jgi:Heparinase II/III-like protein/Heparinase II/III N-terminus